MAVPIDKPSNNKIDFKKPFQIGGVPSSCALLVSCASLMILPNIIGSISEKMVLTDASTIVNITNHLYGLR